MATTSPSCAGQAAQRHVERLAPAPVAQGQVGANAFTDLKEPLSPVGRQWMAGLLDHARAAAAFSTRRSTATSAIAPSAGARPRHLGRDNRGVMVRVLGGPGDPASHLENGSASRRPILSYMASQS